MSEGVEESGSLADHETQFSPEARARATEVETEAPAEPEQLPLETSEPEGTETATQKAERERDEKTGKFTKHRAQSQKASAEDAPRIRELTKRLREAEERAAELERRSVASSSQGTGTNHRQEQPNVSASSEFPDREPTIEQFEKEADPYAAWIRAVNRWDRKKEAWEADQARIATEKQRVEADGQAYLAQKSNEYKAKVEEFSATHPDFNDLIAEFDDWNLPPLAGAAILEHENGPQLVYNLVKRPDELAGLILLTDGKPVTEKTVALATRWLENRALDAKTGSPAPVVQRKPTPTPPNPVRTVPGGSVDSDDIESMSLSSFEKKFHKGRR